MAKVKAVIDKYGLVEREAPAIRAPPSSTGQAQQQIRQYGYTSASARFILIASPGGGINVPFTSVGDITWTWKRVGLRMDDTSWKTSPW